MTMSEEKAAALRKPFPPEAIGKLPKGGVMLDYAGHAVVTDRLLQVDPAWSWEPMATDERGLPIADSKGNLWIRLTICGVTRIGVGDGPTAKVVIGDAIRNAAMRFGVALDLWSKEELEQGTGSSRRKATGISAAEAAEDAKAATGEMATPPPETRRMSRGGPPPAATKRESQERKMFALLREAGHTDRNDMLAYIGTVTGRTIESRTDITDDELTAVVAELQNEAAS